MASVLHAVVNLTSDCSPELLEDVTLDFFTNIEDAYTHTQPCQRSRNTRIRSISKAKRRRTQRSKHFIAVTFHAYVPVPSALGLPGAPLALYTTRE